MPPIRSARAIGHARLAAQQISHHDFATPAEVVTWLGAVQAQDYLGCLWAVGLRVPGATAETIEQAIADGSIIRTHVYRGTIQLVAPADARWMLDLVASRVDRGAGSRYRELGLDAATLARARDVLAAAVAGGNPKTRDELRAALAAAGIATDGQRFIHMVFHAEYGRAICSGPTRGKQVTYAAFDERIPAAEPRDRASAVAELARRFFRSRSPARLRDFAWWTGLPLGELRAGIAACAGDLATAPPAGAAIAPPSDAYLLPSFDEYTIGYADRGDVLDPAHASAVNSGGGMLKPLIVVDGRVVGSWRRTVVRRGAFAIELQPFGALSRRARRLVDAAAERYAAFFGAPLDRVT